MRLFLEPEDVWLFRDGRPFDAGTIHRARSLFPPYPSAIQGAIRSHELAVKGIELHDKQKVKEAVGTTSDYGPLRLSGPFLAKYEEETKTLTRYFPMPADAFPSNKDGQKMKALIPEERPNKVLVSTTYDDVPLMLLPRDFEPGKKEYGDWLDETALKNYLGGKSATAIGTSHLFTTESRLGIKLAGNSRAAEQGMLYVAEFIRPCVKVGLYVEFEGYANWPSTGIMRFGGEGHAARYREVNASSWTLPPDRLPERFKIYFATPTYFDKGWKPHSWEDFFDGRVSLQAVALKEGWTNPG